MANRVTHAELAKIMNALNDAKFINIDASVRSLMESVAPNLRQGEEVSLHVLCCNEYAVITGLQDNFGINELRDQVDSLRKSIGR